MASIQKKEEGKWVARVSFGRHPRTGKHVIRTRTFPRERDAKKWAREQEKQKDSGAVVLPSKEPLGEYLERWLSEVAARRVRARTLDDYRGVVRRYILDPPAGAPPLAGMRLDRLTPSAFRALYRFLAEDRSLSPRTVRYLHQVLRMALADAEEDGILAGNPAHLARKALPSASGGAEAAEDYSAKAMTAEEARAFLGVAELDRWAALWYVLLIGGLRPSEAYALHWEDLEGDTLQVRRSLTRRGVKGWKLTAPKTKHGRREVTLPPAALELLREERRTQATLRLKVGPAWPGHGFIFTTESGEPLQHPNVFRRHFLPIMEGAGLGTWEGEGRRRRFRAAFRMYDLRHTACTLLLAAGELPTVVSKRMGHHSVEFTLSRYAHVLPGQETAAAARLGALLDTATAHAAGG